jgi:serine/threonine protein kinase
MNYKLANFAELKQLGKGQYGRVFKAKYLPSNKIFAIKEIEKQKDNQNQEIAISREIKTMNSMSNIKHPNIMEYFGCFIENNHYYLVLEYINGENLEIYRDKYQIMNQNMNQDLIILILKGIVNGLLYLHSKKILHRDISPDNIMIDKDNNIKITDFGISRLFDLNNPSDCNEWEGTIVGKQYYCSQEMFQEYILGKKYAKYDFKTDIYSLGVTMFNLMTFKFPYDIDIDKKIKIRNNNNIDPNIYNPDLINIVMSMLEPNKNKRPSCQEVYNELCNLIGKNNMDIYYNMKTEDINLEDNYINKRSAFFSVIYSLYNVTQIKSNFIIDNVKKKVDIQKVKSKESVVVIDSFIEIIKNFKDKKNRLNNIIKFIGNVSQKITIFKNCNIITPKLIIDCLFNYFFTNMARYTPKTCVAYT